MYESNMLLDRIYMEKVHVQDYALRGSISSTKTKEEFAAINRRIHAQPWLKKNLLAYGILRQFYHHLICILLFGIFFIINSIRVYTGRVKTFVPSSHLKISNCSP